MMAKIIMMHNAEDEAMVQSLVKKIKECGEHFNIFAPHPFPKVRYFNGFRQPLRLLFKI